MVLKAKVKEGNVYRVQILRDNSCEYAQGYYYDRPLPLDEFEKRLEVGEYPIN